ncbi:MAG: RNA methyltransferase [Syntrophomonas sp.]
MLKVKPILSRDNQKIKHASKLKHKKFRNQEQAFLIEGPKMLEEALLKRPESVLRVFVDQNKEQAYREYTEKYNDLEWYIMESKLIEYISDTDTPQGIVAVIRQPSCSLDELMSGANLLLLLDQISDPGNLGTIIRSAWAFEVDGILLTRECVDPYSPKVVRATMGGIFNVPIISDFTADDIEPIKTEGFQVMCSSLEANRSCYALDFGAKSMVVIGSESRGVSSEVRSQCDTFFKIPTNPQVDSLNAAVACAIIINEAWKQKTGCSLSE